MSSQAEFEIIMKFIGTETIVKGNIERFHSPQTFEALLDQTRDTGSFSVRSRANIGREKTFWMLLVDLKRGGEKTPHKPVNIGDIVYCPRQDAIYLIFNKPVLQYPVYFLGKITEGIEKLPEMRNGTMVRIELHEKLS